MSTDNEQQDGPEEVGPEASAESPGKELVAPTAGATAPVVDVGSSRTDDLRNRLLMPLLLPLASIFVVVLVALNISRLFLAGGKEQAPAVIVATAITVGILIGAAALSAARHVRTSSLVLGLSLVLVLIFSAGLITFGSGEEKKEATGSAAPTGPPVNTFQVDALAALAFQASEFNAVAGINEIEYVGKGGTHTLVFSDPALDYFLLAVPQGPTKGKVLLEAGKDYDIYCTIPGHRAAGMEAVVKTTAGPPPAAGAGDSTTTTLPGG